MALSVEAFDAAAMWPPATLPTALVAPQQIVVARYADRGFLSRTTDTPASKLYEARLMGDVEIAQSIVDAVTVGGAVATTASELELWNGDDALNGIASGGRMDGRPIAIKTVAVSNRQKSDWGGSLAGATSVWMGQVARVNALGLKGRIQLSDLSNKLNTLLQTNLFDGLGGLGGPEELKGLPKPVSVGWRYNVAPVFLGNVDLGDGALPTYTSHFRAIAGHEAVRIRGVLQELVGSAPGIGQYVDKPASGCFQLGSSADGPVTCDVRGDAPGGVFANSTLDALRFVLTAMGPALSASELDPQSWFEAGPRMSQAIGWGLGTTPVTAAQALGEILTGCAGFMYGTRGGKIGVGLIGAPAAVPRLTIEASDVVDLKAEPVPFSLQPTPQAVEIRASRNWAPLDDVAGSVDAATRAALASEGKFERAFSSAIAARSTQVRQLQIEGLYRRSEDALARAGELRTWLERGLRMITVTTDRFLGAVELGMTARVTYPYFGLSAGWSGTVVAWREKIGARRVELTLLG